MVAPIVAASAISGIAGLFGANRAASAQANAAERADRAQREQFGIARRDAIRGVTMGNDSLVRGQNNALRELGSGYWDSRGTINQGYDQAENRTINAFRDQAGIFQPTIDRGNAASDARDFVLGIGDQPAGYDGYQNTDYHNYLLDETSGAIEGSAAASGGLFSGATLKALQSNASGLAGRFQDNYLNQLGTVAGQGLAAGGAMANAAGVRGANMANLATGRGNALTALRGGLAADRANIHTGTAQGRASLYGSLGQNLSSLSVGSGNARAQSIYGAGNAQAAGAIGGANAISDAVGNGLGAWLYMQDDKKPGL